MAEENKKRMYILWAGAGLLGATAIFAILVLTGVITPIIFPPTGLPLDVSPLASAIVTFLMLIILIYVSTRVLDFGLKYPKDDATPKETK